jgi:hypothetical protein
MPADDTDFGASRVPTQFTGILNGMIDDIRNAIPASDYSAST